jgi:hypothetical protein
MTAGQAILLRQSSVPGREISAIFPYAPRRGPGRPAKQEAVRIPKITKRIFFIAMPFSKNTNKQYVHQSTIIIVSIDEPICITDYMIT